jgi:hypothetical protein
MHPKLLNMKTFYLAAACTLVSLQGFTQNNCATSFKRNNGNGTCGLQGELRLTFPGGCPANVPYIDSVYINNDKTNVAFSAPDNSKCNGANAYISYCVVSGNMPPANIWKIFFRNPDGSSYTCDVSSTGIVPVVFSSFTATLTGSTIVCRWNTENETDNKYFELERSADGLVFNSIARINSNTQGSYQYTDAAASILTANTIYYRVKQVDNSGSFSYSKVFAIKNGIAKNDIIVTPNPFKQNINISFNSTASTLTEIKLLNVNGQTAAVKKLVPAAGQNTCMLNGISQLPKGVYMIQVIQNGQVIKSQQLLKQ